MSKRETDFNASNDSERRERFRVDDAAILEIAAVDADALEKVLPESFFEPSSAFRLMRDLGQIDQQNSSTLRSIGEQFPEIASYFEALEEKIGVIGNAIAEGILHDKLQLQSIDLSEGGIGFKHEHALEEGGFYALKVWFHQALVGIAVYARVVGCNRAIDGRQHISASFHQLSDANQQIIARHIMQVQAKQQRLKKLIHD
jgi:hypothetical protein